MDDVSRYQTMRDAGATPADVLPPSTTVSRRTIDKYNQT
jgi:hypothetical protein